MILSATAPFASVVGKKLTLKHVKVSIGTRDKDARQL